VIISPPPYPARLVPPPPRQSYNAGGGRSSLDTLDRPERKRIEVAVGLGLACESAAARRVAWQLRLRRIPAESRKVLVDIFIQK